jgi:hypothetical protein
MRPAQRNYYLGLMGFGMSSLPVSGEAVPFPEGPAAEATSPSARPCSPRACAAACNSGRAKASLRLQTRRIPLSREQNYYFFATSINTSTRDSCRAARVAPP